MTVLVKDWKPSEKNWGDLAHREVMATFDGQLKNRAVALCVWFLAQDAGASPYAIESLARRDPDIEARADGAKITSYCLRQARKILGGGSDGGKPQRRANERRRSTRRRPKTVVSNAVAKLDDAGKVSRLRDGAAVVDEFLHASAELAHLQAAFAKARSELLKIPHEDAIELAELVETAGQALAREGLLTPPGEDTGADWPTS